MNVFEKLNKARVMFQEANVKKSGQNKYAGYNYFELNDILPICNKICNEIKAVCVLNFTESHATLQFIDCEKTDDVITFESPMSEATLKGCHKVQNLGAVETYIKRYLYQNCFEIAENDALDSQPINNNQNVNNANNTSNSGTQKKESLPKWTKEQSDSMNGLMAKFPENRKTVYRNLMKNTAPQDLIEMARAELETLMEQSQYAETQYTETQEPYDIFKGVKYGK